MKNKTACLPPIIYALALAQHHDAVIGTEKQHVAYDYAERIARGYTESEKVVATSLNCIAESSSKTGCGSQVSQFQQVVVSDMLRHNVGDRPIMKWHIMCMTKMQFEDEMFDVVLDKGDLDALMEPELGSTLGNQYILDVMLTD
ncbi:hypothetical protein ACFE04_014919 [Oxalis oulophora]